MRRRIKQRLVCGSLAALVALSLLTLWSTSDVTHLPRDGDREVTKIFHDYTTEYSNSDESLGNLLDKIRILLGNPQVKGLFYADVQNDTYEVQQKREKLLDSVRVDSERVRVVTWLNNEMRVKQRAEEEKNRTRHILPENIVADLRRVVDKLTRVPRKTTTQRYLHHEPPTNRSRRHRVLPAWKRFENGINRYSLYDDDNVDVVDELLVDLQRELIVDLEDEMRDSGTQIKFLFQLSNGARALFKPQKVPRDYEVPLDVYYFNELERHHAEIAAYHLDRVLGFHRVPPVAGRKIHMKEDIYQLAESGLKSTFFRSPMGNTCMWGRCDYFCDSRHALCGDGDVIEGSMAAFLPDDIERWSVKSPWRRSYSKRTQAAWQLYPDTYCEGVRRAMGGGRRLLDVVDLHVFDFLTGNQDRHHLTQFKDPHNDTFLIAFDNGRAFGRPGYDDLSILAPLTQCCVLRASTFIKLMEFETGGVSLGEAVRRSLQSVPLEEILRPPHLLALDRRVRLILRHLHTCLTRHPLQQVITDDGL